MKIVCDTRQLQTPQTTTRGRVRKNVNGDPVYTTYLNLSARQYQDLKQHMRRYIDTISNFNDEEFDLIAQRIDFEERTQIDNEPAPYNFLQRLKFVLDRLDRTDDMTTGVVDMYNHVVCRTLRALDFPVHSIQRARVEIEDPVLRQMRNQLDPELFSLGD